MLKFKLKSVAAGAAFGVVSALTAGAAFAEQVIGQPTDKALGLQASGDGPGGLRTEAMFFHNAILLPIITIITLFVLGLLIWIIVRYNKRSNPVPAKFSHNTALEIAWTTIPVLILMFIAIFSFRLLFHYHDMPKPDLTIKVTGNQWYWSYEYPKSEGGMAFDSNPLSEAEAKAKGVPFKLAVNHPLVVPAGKVIQVQVTGADVLHSFFIPAFGVQTTAVPGKLNSVWFRAAKPGVYYGECNELCGVQHYFMPIEIDARSPADYAAWVESQKKPAAPAATAVATPAAPAASAPAPAGAAPAAAPAAASPAATHG
jgi:cytochrome c oxidase subunit 2